MGHKTPLYQKHLQAGGKMVDFAGWDMPLHYGSQLEEHHQVRQDAGVFDVSHMTIVDVEGEQAYDFLRWLVANDVSKLKEVGKALYTCMLNEQGGVVDDLIVYKLGEQRYRLVVNAGTREKDIAWIKKQSKNFSVQLQVRTDLTILAIQGPQAIAKVEGVFPPKLYQSVQALRPFHALEHQGWMIARTGYTGEDGIEALVPADEVGSFWDALIAIGVKPCGLGARDTLRLEAGLNLYGADMDEKTSPLESNLAWTIAWDENRDFVGRRALEAKKNNGAQRLVGLVLEQKGVLRNHQKVIIPGVGEGEITSGSFSPTLQLAIALARVPAAIGDSCLVEIRGQQVPARVVKPPFVRHGQKVFK